MEKVYAGDEYLLTYKLSIIVYDLTVQFTQNYINHYSHTVDQMVQAARSGKQNIAEGYKQASLKTYIKLTGVSLGSEEELLNDIKDFARQNSIKVYPVDVAKQKNSLEQKFIHEGGFSENLLRKRLKERSIC